MIRLLVFILIVFALGLGFAWLADRPGTMLVSFQGYDYQISLLVAAVAVVTIVAAILITWWVLKAIWTSPRTLNRYFRARKRDRGYQSLSTGMLAAGAGDAVQARRMAKQALQNLSADQEPLIHLLEAQTRLLEGDNEGARKKFEAMLDDPETRLLGLHGLYREANRLGEPAAARHYAEEAAAEAPQLGWASNSVMEARCAAGDWDDALKLLETQATTGQLTKERANRHKAVLLTARAIAQADADPLASRNAAQEALRLAPDLVPAAIAAAKALVRLNDMRKAAKILETIWKKDPHPEVADTYVHLRPGDSTHDRLARAQRLLSIRNFNAESQMAVAQAAFEAGEYAKAREALDAVLKQKPRESAYLLLADIEEEETGDQGRVRHWLARAVRAPRDPAWTADGFVSEHWAPFSPVTGRIDAFEWKVPVERLGPVVEAGKDEDDTSAAAIPVFPPASPVKGDAAEAAEMPAESPALKTIDIEAVPEKEQAATPAAAGKDAGNAKIHPDPTQPIAAESAGDTGADADAENTSPASSHASADSDADGDAGAGAGADPETASTSGAAKPEKENGSGASEREKRGLPDDPGVDPNAPPEPSGNRFRLF